MLFIARVALIIVTLSLGLPAAARQLPVAKEQVEPAERKTEEEPHSVEAERVLRNATAAAQVAAGVLMVDIPGGEFLMGSAIGLADEKPVHRVAVRPFRLGKYEVTFEQYDVYCQLMRDKCPDDGRWGRGTRPVMNVSWNDANAFIAWLNTGSGRRFRLPTEAEWEYAARAGTTTDYPWGNQVKPGMANCDSSCGDAFVYTAPVGSFPPNAFGLHDMHGNVWEWTQDCYHSTYSGAPSEGSAWTTDACAVRVVRSGSWASAATWLRSSDRDWDGAAYRSGTRSRGFRLAEDP